MPRVTLSVVLHAAILEVAHWTEVLELLRTIKVQLENTPNRMGGFPTRLGRVIEDIERQREEAEKAIFLACMCARQFGWDSRVHREIREYYNNER